MKPCFKFKWNENKHCSEKCRYTKYIPVDLQFGNIYPKSSVDLKSPSSWLDIQLWYVQYFYRRDRKSSIIDKSKSDSVVQHKKNTSFSSSSTDVLLKSVEFDGNSAKKEEVFSNVYTNSRFGENNESYLTLASAMTFKYTKTPIEIYVQMTKNQYSFLQLCHIKTEMLVKCLNTFFYPYGDCMVIWVLDLQLHVHRYKTNGISDIFNPDVPRWKGRNKINAIMYLSKEPASLLRHDDMCVLDSIAVVLGIKREELLVIPLS